MILSVWWPPWYLRTKGIGRRDQRRQSRDRLHVSGLIGGRSAIAILIWTLGTLLLIAAACLLVVRWYEEGQRPLQKIDLKEGTRIRIAIEEPSAVIEAAFGLLKGKDTTKALEEQGDEEPLDRAGAQKKIRGPD